jgi:hypothetical protein
MPTGFLGAAWFCVPLHKVDVNSFLSSWIKYYMVWGWSYTKNKRKESKTEKFLVPCVILGNYNKLVSMPFYPTF